MVKKKFEITFTATLGNLNSIISSMTVKEVFQIAVTSVCLEKKTGLVGYEDRLSIYCRQKY